MNIRLSNERIIMGMPNPQTQNEPTPKAPSKGAFKAVRFRRPINGSNAIIATVSLNLLFLSEYDATVTPKQEPKVSNNPITANILINAEYFSISELSTFMPAHTTIKKLEPAANILTAVAPVAIMLAMFKSLGIINGSVSSIDPQIGQYVKSGGIVLLHSGQYFSFSSSKEPPNFWDFQRATLIIALSKS